MERFIGFQDVVCLATRYGSSTRSSVQHYGIGAGKWACLGAFCSNCMAGEFLCVFFHTDSDDDLGGTF